MRTERRLRESATPVERRRWCTAQIHDRVLGAPCQVIVNAPTEMLVRAASGAARAEMRRLSRTLDHRDMASEISALNRLRSMGVSSDLFAVLRLAETWRSLSGGAFDGRLGHLLRLWQGECEPKAAQLERALAALHTAGVKLDPHARSATLEGAIQLSLDALAKGYIVDRAIAAARAAVPGLRGIAVCIDRSIRCHGEAFGAMSWRIGMFDPAPHAQAALESLALRNRAIATRHTRSEAYRLTLSPHDGRPPHGVESAVVLASHAADADAIATACLVMSPRQGLAFVNRLEGVAARIVDASGAVHLSEEWPI